MFKSKGSILTLAALESLIGVNFTPSNDAVR